MSELDAPPKMEFWEDTGARGHLDHGGRAGPPHPPMELHNSGGVPSGGGGHSQYERNLNFATGAVEENEYGFPKKKTVRDPLSHRIIEKRRRDRMNNCLADLARLLPPSSLRKGRGRIEKTEIVELAIKHLKHLQCHPCSSGDNCEYNYIVKGSQHENNYTRPPTLIQGLEASNGSTFNSTPEEHFRLGFNECMSETMHFLVEEEGMYPGDTLCIRMLKHLRTHSESLMTDHFGKDGKLRFLNETIKNEENEKNESTTHDFNNGSCSSGYQANASSSGSDGNGGQDLENSFQIPGSNGAQQTAQSERAVAINIDYEGENSCCSTQLSLDISDVFSVDGKSTGGGGKSTNKPPIPTLICSNSSMSSSPKILNSSSNGRSSDEGHESAEGSSPRYKFKNNIKQRFVADLVVPSENGTSKVNLVTKASLKQTQSQDLSAGQSDNEEEDSVTKRRESVVEIEEDCISHKSFSTTISARQRTSSTNSSINKSIYNNGPIVKSPSVEWDRDIVADIYPNIKILSPEELKAPKPPVVVVSSALSAAAAAIKSGCGVPAFALHEKGLYYIPFTIDKATLSPYLAHIDSNNPPPLHPVTISVCFLLAQQEKARLLGGPLHKDSPPPSMITVPITSPNNFLPSVVERFANLPMAFPLLAANPLTPVKVSKSSPKDSGLNNNFHMNRFSQNRQQQQQYNPQHFPYRYPIAGNLPSPQNLSQKDHLAANQHQLYPGYYVNETHHSHPPPTSALIPSHLNGGYSSTSSNSSTCSGGNHGRHGRKRSIASISPLSGSGSSLGYHSFNDKYSLSSQDSFSSYTPTTNYSTSSHSSVRQHSSGTMHSHSGYGLANHIMPYNNFGGRSCSPSKRVKKGGREDSKLPIGLPIIPLPPSK